jgi:1,4-alpha-glucan branching enzyme
MTFSLMYTFNENYILAYSHDEVVHGKLSMIGKMYGDYWQKFASLRTLFGFMYAHPGKKLMFMGDEFAQFIEWDYKKQLDWFLLEYASHRGMSKYVRALNRLYRETPALYEIDEGWDGFEWLNVDDSDTSVFAFVRMGADSNMICVANFTPLVRDNYPVAMPGEGKLKLVLSSDDEKYGGSGVSPDKTMQAVPMDIEGRGFGVRMTLPPLSVLYFRFEPGTRKQNRRGRNDK